MIRGRWNSVLSQVSSAIAFGSFNCPNVSVAALSLLAAFTRSEKWSRRLSDDDLRPRHLECLTIAWWWLSGLRPHLSACLQQELRSGWLFFDQNSSAPSAWFCPKATRGHESCIPSELLLLLVLLVSGVLRKATGTRVIRFKSEARDFRWNKSSSPVLIRPSKKERGMLKQFSIFSLLTWQERINALRLLSLKNSFKRWCTSSFRPSDFLKKKAHKRNEGTPSFRRRHWSPGLEERSLYRALILPALVRKTLNKILVSHSSDHPRRTNCDDRKMWIVTRSPTIVRMNPARRWISPTRSRRLLRSTHLSCLFSDVTTTGECQITTKKSASEDSPENFVRVKRPLFPAFSFFRHLVLQSFTLFCLRPLQRPRHVASHSQNYSDFHTTTSGRPVTRALKAETLYRYDTQTIHRTSHSIFPVFLPCFLVLHDIKSSSDTKVRPPAVALQKTSHHIVRHFINMPDESKYGPDLDNLEMISVVAYKIFERNPNDYLVTSCISFILSSPVRSFTCFEVLDPVLHIANRSVLARSSLTMFFSSSQHVVQCDVALRSRNHAGTRCVHFVLLASNIVLLSPFSNGPFKQSKHLFIVKTVPSVALHFNTHTHMTMHDTSFLAFTCFPFILVYHTPSDVTSRCVSYHNNTKRCVYLPCTFSTKNQFAYLTRQSSHKRNSSLNRWATQAKARWNMIPTRKLVRNATPVTDTPVSNFLSRARRHRNL